MTSKKAIKKYLSRWEAVEAVEREEMRQATIKLRWQQFKVLSNLALGLGLKVEKNEIEEMAIILRWSRIKDFYANSR